MHHSVTFPVFLRSHSRDKLEISVEGTKVVVAAINRALQNGIIGICKTVACFAYAASVNIAVKGNTHSFFKIS